MVENATLETVALYGITAVRYAGTHIVEAMMGLIDPSQTDWDLRPTPTRLSEVVDKLVEGDRVVSVFADGEGHLAAGPDVMVDVLAEGTETLVFADEAPGRSIRDLPTY